MQILKDKIILISNYEKESIIEFCAPQENNIFQVQKEIFWLNSLTVNAG